jgi:hypothetical protein
MLFYEGDRESYNNQVSSSISRGAVNEMLNNADVRDRTSSSSQIYFPDWYMKGLIAHVAGTWDFETESRVKEGLQITGSKTSITSNMMMPLCRPVILAVHCKNIRRTHYSEYNLPDQNIQKHR